MQSTLIKSMILAENERRLNQFTISRKDNENLFNLKAKLDKWGAATHAHVGTAYNGLSINEAIQFKPALRAFFFLFYYSNPAVKVEAMNILERHGFAIIKNPEGKGHRVISTRF